MRAGRALASQPHDSLKQRQAHPATAAGVLVPTPSRPSSHREPSTAAPRVRSSQDLVLDRTTSPRPARTSRSQHSTMAIRRPAMRGTGRVKAPRKVRSSLSSSRDALLRSPALGAGCAAENPACRESNCSRAHFARSKPSRSTRPSTVSRRPSSRCRTTTSRSSRSRRRTATPTTSSSTRRCVRFSEPGPSLEPQS